MKNKFSLIKLIDGIIVVPTSLSEASKLILSLSVLLYPDLDIEQKAILAVGIKAVLGALHWAYKYSVLGDFVDGAKNKLRRKNHERNR